MDKKSTIINLLEKAVDINKYKKELILSFSSLPTTELISIVDIIVDKSIYSTDGKPHSISELSKLDFITQFSIYFEQTGFLGIDICSNLNEYCGNIGNNFAKQNFITYIRSPKIISVPGEEAKEIKSITIKKMCFDLIGKLSDDRSHNLLFFVNDILRIDNYIFTFEITKLLDETTAIEFVQFFNSENDNYFAKRNCFKEELIELLKNIDSKLRCQELFKNLNEILINSKARFGRYVSRTSQASVNSTLKELTEKYLPELSSSIQTITADIIALVGNIVLLSNIDFSNSLSISNIIFFFITIIFDVIFSIVLKSRLNHIDFIQKDLNQIKEELKEYNPKDKNKISSKIESIEKQVIDTKNLLRALSFLLWLPCIIVFLGIVSNHFFQLVSSNKCPLLSISIYK